MISEKTIRLSDLLIALSVLLITAGCDVRNKDKQAIDTIEKPAATEMTTVEIIDSTHDFGEVMEGEVVEFDFKFKNSGTKPLIVTNATASCGCTVPEKPEKPIMPGETGFIKAKFNTDKRPGDALKTVSVTSNARPDFPGLVIKGKVLPKKIN